MPQSCEPIAIEGFERLLESPPFDMCLRDCDRPIAVGVSGGADSMALAFLLSRWLNASDRPAAHALVVDHGLRPHSAEEAGRVAGWLRALPRMDPHTLRWEGPAPRSRIMERARAARYKLLEAYCSRAGIGALFLAHHQDDQAETFLFRLAKGSGLDGLCGMMPVRYTSGLALLRPFLGFSKDQILRTCAYHGIQFVDDPSNRNEAFARPRLRSARAALEREGLTGRRLSVVAGRLSRARSALEFYTARAFERCVRDIPDKDIIEINLGPLSGEPEDVRFRVIACAVQHLRPVAETNSLRVEKLEALANALFSANPFRRRTLGGLIFSRAFDGRLLIIEKEKP